MTDLQAIADEVRALPIADKLELATSMWRTGNTRFATTVLELAMQDISKAEIAAMLRERGPRRRT